MGNKSYKTEEIHEQFKMLMNKIEKQNIVTTELMREVSKSKIQKFEFWRYWIFNILLVLMSILAIYAHSVSDYPLWMLIPYIYMIGLALYAWMAGEKNQREYLKKIDYDIVKYWEEQEKEKKHSTRSIIQLCLILLPLLISGGFNCYYAIAVDCKIVGIYNFLIVISTIVLIIFASIFLNKKYKRFLIRISK